MFKDHVTSSPFARIVLLAPMLAAAGSFTAHAQPLTVQQCQAQCKQQCTDEIPIQKNCPSCDTRRATCVANCEKDCQPPRPCRCTRAT
jgi:hypothetical protein